MMLMLRRSPICRVEILADEFENLQFPVGEELHRAGFKAGLILSEVHEDPFIDLVADIDPALQRRIAVTMTSSASRFIT